MKAIDELFDRTILIVDDEITNREMLANILSDEYKIIMAAEGIRSVLEKNGGIAGRKDSDTFYI